MPRFAHTTPQGNPLSKDLNENDRANLALLVMGILEEWRLSPEAQLALLGMPEKTKPRELSRFKRGTPLPDDENVLNHAKHILGIQDALHLVFPLNRNMPLFWLNHRNRQLKGIPMQIMLQDGLYGMRRVWGILDCTVNWEE